jgi:hypothetical protein
MKNNEFYLFWSLILVLFSPFALGRIVKFEDIHYSVNLMWINSSLNPHQEYLCNEREACLNPIKNWVEKSDKRAEINIWYDSKFSSEIALEKTKNELRNILNPDATFPNFRDIRALQFVKDNENIFSQVIPVYFRADLLRIIATYELALKKDRDFFVYADFNVPALSKKELFDPETLNQLNNFGLVMSRNPIPIDANYENGFFILDAFNPSMMQATKLGLIDINIQRANEILRRGYSSKQEGETLGQALCESKFPQIVWTSYTAMFKYYLFLEMAAEVLLPGDSLTSLIKKEQLYHNVNLLPNPYISRPHSTFGERFIFSRLYDEGFAKVSKFWTFGEGELNEHIILDKVNVKDVDAALTSVEEEIQRRRTLHETNIDFMPFSIHKTIFQPRTYLWKNKFVINYWGNDENKIQVITLESSMENELPSFFFIPTKDVNKPQSHFYNVKIPVKENGC